MAIERMFNTGDEVTVVIYGARLHRFGDHDVQVCLPGVDDPISIPTVDDDGEPLDAVTVSDMVPQVQPGEVWRARTSGDLFFATQAPEGTVLVSRGHKAFSPAEVVDHWGPIDMIASAEFPWPYSETLTGPTPDANLLAARDVRVGDWLHSLRGWHTVLGEERPAGDGPGHIRFYTNLAPIGGLLYRLADDVWVRRTPNDTPLYAELTDRQPATVAADDPPSDTPQIFTDPPSDDPIRLCWRDGDQPLAAPSQEIPPTGDAATVIFPRVTAEVEEPVR